MTIGLAQQEHWWIETPPVRNGGELVEHSQALNKGVILLHPVIVTTALTAAHRLAKRLFVGAAVPL
jgi:hypothetical protein